MLKGRGPAWRGCAVLDRVVPTRPAFCFCQLEPQLLLNTGHHIPVSWGVLDCVARLCRPAGATTSRSRVAAPESPGPALRLPHCRGRSPPTHQQGQLATLCAVCVPFSASWCYFCHCECLMGQLVCPGPRAGSFELCLQRFLECWYAASFEDLPVLPKCGIFVYPCGTALLYSSLLGFEMLACISCI